MFLRLACTTLLLSFLAACATNGEPSEPDDIIFEPAAVVYWPVEPSKEFRATMMSFENEFLQQSKSATRYVTGATLHKSLAAMQGIEDYNKFMARPTGGEPPLLVDCRSTGEIWFVFVAGRPSSKRSVSRFTMSYEFTNPMIDGKAGRKAEVLTSSDSFFVADAERRRGRPMYVASLSFDDERNSDGLWTLTISHRGHEKHTEQFDVRGCS